MTIIINSIISAGLMTVLTSSIFALNDEPNLTFSQSVDEVFADHNTSDTPGCSVGVIKDGKFIHQAGYGMASLELDVKIVPDTVFRIASVSKQFTAAAVLLLVDDGLVDLDADIGSYLTDLPEYKHKVTVRSMLGHYSGMKGYGHISGSYEGPKEASEVDLRSPLGRPFRIGNEDYLTNDEFYEVVKKLKLKHEPDTKFEYNNIGYYLLSKLVEVRTGKSLRAFADERIFGPLGMTNSYFSDQPFEIIKNRAQGYKPKKGGGYVNDMTNLFTVGDGGLHTSVNDMLKWDQNFYNPKLGKDPAAFKTAMNTPTSAHKSGDSLYAYGQSKRVIEGRNAYTHSGGWLGTTSYYARFEDDSLSVISLCNDANINKLGDRVIAVVDAYFKGH